MNDDDDRNQITIRSAGRHVKPSQPEAAAKDAGPVPAMTGVLLPMQQSHVKAAKPAAPATEQVCSDAVTQATRTYTVRAGGMLSSTAERFSGNAVGRHWIYAANQSKIANPDLILIVWQLVIPYDALSSATAPMARTSASAASSLSRTPSCRQPEELWPRAGRTPSEAFATAEIAMAGSRGDQHATGRYGEVAYWQINPDHGSLATCDPEGTAKAAVIISGDGTSWTRWTTFVPGAYEGQC